ncbi:hypothetical protein VE01_01197 [Pseudogymnoascus verrucosus]|uniref:Uncharacterized protein n=1 Tax=Pseudogymnoascus verrucosus TaxID=342668 RepID=A0A1B8GY25_9PEZI|nr:uncharacterized protein VE01_01197 [Pseudogymnoascus verrucosus]OBU00752.1 hypothetical protein VE01_01197 [Pseudogymnoascus verrucosus]
MSPQGTPITRQIDVWLGDRGSAYVYFDPEFSQPFQADRALQGDESSSNPRLEIPQDLVGRAGATQGNSPATLHLWGMANAITLDRTADYNWIPALPSRVVPGAEAGIR